jgi:hypothetical protein
MWPLADYDHLFCTLQIKDSGCHLEFYFTLGSHWDKEGREEQRTNS